MVNTDDPCQIWSELDVTAGDAWGSHGIEDSHQKSWKGMQAVSSM